MVDAICERLKRAVDWNPPETWRRITTIDAHAAGEPLRIVLDGFPELPGGTIPERRLAAREHYDHLRRVLMWEPRGHADMYGCIVTPPVSPEADFGVLFLHNEGYSSMCGHGIIAVTTVVLETGVLPMHEPVTQIKIDTPAGLVTARAHVGKGRVERVAFENVASYVVALDQVVTVPSLGEVCYDLAFGGAYYAYVAADSVGLRCLPDDYDALIQKGMAIKRAVMAAREIEHPVSAELGFLYGTIFIGPPVSKDAHSRNVCIFADGEVDRSPTGTGVSGRVAIHHARGELRHGEDLVVESILGSRFTGRVAAETQFGPYKAVVPEVEGSGFITGRHCFLIDPNDPLKNGFLPRIPST